MSDRDETARRRQDNLRPEPENQAQSMRPPAGSSTDGPPDSTADESRDTGSGTGGATDSDGRPRHNEAVHLGNQPNS